MKFFENSYEALSSFAALIFRPFIPKGVSKNGPEDILTVPNLVSALRVPLALALFPLKGNWSGSLAVVIVAALTDISDGALAKRYFGRTRTGAVIDPLFDKLFFFLFAAAYWQELRGVALYILVGIEGCILLLQITMLVVCKIKKEGLNEYDVRSNVYGKWKFCLECLSLTATFFSSGLLPAVVMWVAAVFAVLSILKKYKDTVFRMIMD